MHDAAIYRRTDAGRREIRNKTHGLTQSERLVLIMVDGAANCADLRARLPVLERERFDRALAHLVKSGLIIEVLVPASVMVREEIDRSVLDRFLQQDPQDPLTVLMCGVEALDDEDWRMAPKPPALKPLSTLDDADIRLVDSIREEVQALQEARTLRLEPIEVAAQRIFDLERAREAQERAGGWRHFLPHVLLLVGIAFIAGFVVARLAG